ncbi:PLP-dependent aminotransferase family protein [Leptolyngbya sp. AN03gr2]|uniref:MocR-like pyridoxine biosynthesis transcription factor PdxR n=1 Tax=unclassified Leptolyngbya TaxID=2650499 RepID=UPI003D3235BE
MELTLNVDHDSKIPLHQQVYTELRGAILCGRLLPGERVPSTRSLSRSLGISRTTVTQSYEQLLSEGYLETHHGSGTFICRQLPDELLHTEKIATHSEATSPPIRLSRYAHYLAETPFALQPEPEVEISFRYGRPALKQFPIALWRKLLARRCRSDSEWLDYALDPQGYYPLRVEIAQYLSRARAVQCNPKQIVITNGTQQALDLILRVLLEPGDTIALEDPGYLSARKVFLSHGANLLPIPVDESGLIIEKLEHSATDSLRLVYVTPSHQFPTGATLSLTRRLELLKWASKNGTMILEDDYDSEYRYGDRPIPSLQGLDQSDSVLYIGTFSKVLFPSLRIGYLVLPPQLVPLIAHAKWLSDRQLPTLEQQVLTDFITEGHLESHIRKMRAYYDRARQVLVRALQKHFGEQIRILGEKAGIHVMVRFFLPISDAEILQRAKAADVGLMPAAPHYLVDGGKGEFILGYSELDEAAIVQGIDRLASALK